MNVLLLNGSPRVAGNTNLALSEIAKQLEKNGIEAQIMQIGTKSVRGCIACNRCSELGRCVFDDDLCNRVAEKMTLCDALVVGSPVYWGQPNGTLMSLLQKDALFAGQSGGQQLSGNNNTLHNQTDGF